MKREVGTDLQVEIAPPTDLEFQIAVAPHPGLDVSERASLDLGGDPVEPSEIIGAHGYRIHRLTAPEGSLTVEYAATIGVRAEQAPVTDYDLSTPPS